MLETNHVLATLLDAIPAEILHGTVQRSVRGITADSRQVGPEMLFVGIRGLGMDGHRFLGEVLERGATVLVVEEWPAALQAHGQAAGATVVRVPDSRQALALLASAYYGHPARQLRLIGVTGTNGKTTTTYVVESILRAAGQRTGVLGTVTYRFGEQALPASQTTPDALHIHQMLAQMVEAGLGYAIMEVSSHALIQERVHGCPFEVAVFTNLSRDHYDYHGSEAAYFAAKARLFQDFSAPWHVVNSDDLYGQKLLLASPASLVTYGLDGVATLQPHAVSHGLDGIRLQLATPKGLLAIRSPLIGRHNVYNLLAGIGVALALDIDGAAIQQGIAQLHRVPGRLERVEQGQDFAVFVDYAHTPDALEKVLQLVRAETSGRLITVFGCGGDRDPGKRPLMGDAAATLSDYAIVTSDNPRTEDPQQIIDAIVAGIDTQRPYTTIPDRRQAIEYALTMAQAQDTIVIAGKGHEDYQIIGQTRHHFDDCEVAREALTARG